MRFGKIGKPVVLADNNAPYISGLSPNGKLVGAKKGAHRSTATRSSPGSRFTAPTSTRCSGARTLNPWRPEATPLTTPATAAVLPVKAGRWYYKVRGLNPSLPKKPEMTWSKPVSLRIAKLRFRVVKR